MDAFTICSKLCTLYTIFTNVEYFSVILIVPLHPMIKSKKIVRCYALIDLLNLSQPCPLSLLRDIPYTFANSQSLTSSNPGVGHRF